MSFNSKYSDIFNIEQKTKYFHLPELTNIKNESAEANQENNNVILEPIKGPEIKYSMKGHIKSLKCLYQLNDGTLISSANDKKLKFWNLEKKIQKKMKRKN